jgi:hypothetical protein
MKELASESADRRIARCLESLWNRLDAPALHEADQDHDESGDQQDMDQATHRVGGYEPQQPKQHQNNRNCLEHVRSPICQDRDQSQRQSARESEENSSVPASTSFRNQHTDEKSPPTIQISGPCNERKVPLRR